MKEELLNKIKNAGLEIEEVEKEITNDDGISEIKTKQVIKIPRERGFVHLSLPKKENEKYYLESKFELFKFIKDYEAIWSPELKIIECEVQLVDRLYFGPSLGIRRLSRALNQEITDQETPRFDLVESEEGIKVSIGIASIEYAILGSSKTLIGSFDTIRRRLTLKIENINLSTHDNAKKVLEKLGNSVLFKLDITINLGFKLTEDKDIRKSFFRHSNSTYEFDSTFPTYEYDDEPMSLYWYAKGATDMPLLRFLALYQILEFYFPIYSQKDAHQQIKNIIKDPRFNPNKDSDITKILSTISQNKNQLGYGSELDQLKATISNCLSSDEIRDMIELNKEIAEFFRDKKAKTLASKTLNIGNKSSDLISECVERIYEIRCRVVHTKSSDKNYNLLLPSSPELKFLGYDIMILEMIAKKVIISGSRLLKL
ncbi:hypothetical protein [Sphingobacterium sp.]|uniref:hypothetical protein n=1 Tax=Sphingobacterium sp. TaxID=341027 RepID=UPI002588D6C3|nr:hypothetical protein [Sphingobacterium sp.]WET69718.1 MAG: hypothetical protein P0Y57_01255 [Sphingobacterium sp.]